MSGYSGYSKSNNALEAEHNQRYPLSIALKKINGIISKAKAKKFLEQLHTGEYHHTSKFYNDTKYYDVEQLNWLIEQSLKINIELTALVKF